MKDLITIKCPCCGQEYLPGEIYIPKAFMGTPKDVVRKTDGTVSFYVGDDMDLDEEYICDNCLTTFTVHANLSFDVKRKEEKTFEEEYTTIINKPKKLNLEEQLFND